MPYPIMTTPRPVTPSSAVGMPDRHADQSAGSAPGGVGRFIPRWSAPVTLTREGVNGLDDQIMRDRVPFYDQDYLGSHRDSLVNWDDCGPPRPSLHMRQMTVRRQVGSSNTRAFDPHPVMGYGTQDQGHGMHTNPEQAKINTIRNFRARTQQT